jgi:putative ATPase
MAAAQAVDYVGMPEGRFHLAQATLYLATAPKSNSTLAFFDALDAVEREQQHAVPAHLRDASRDREGFGHGAGYLYPHAYRDHWVAQQYLPQALQGRVFYQPGDQGYEQSIGRQVARRREAQLAAILETEVEVLTFDPVERAHDQWLARTVSSVGQRLSALRDRVLDDARLARHHRVLDLNAGAGLLTWEALRRCPEGGVWSLTSDRRSAEALRQQAARLPELKQPAILAGSLDEVSQLLDLRGEADVRFEAIVGRSALTREPDRSAVARQLLPLLAAGGVVSLAESVPRHTQRLWALVDLSSLEQDLAERLRQAEDAIYADPDNPLVNWGADELQAAFEDAGFGRVELSLERSTGKRYVSSDQLERWFQAGAGQPTYGDWLRRALSADELEQVERLFRRQLAGQTVAWQSATAYLRARPGAA